MDTQAQNNSLNNSSEQSNVAKVKHILTDGVYVKTYLVPANMRVKSKTFDHAHLAILAQGSIIIKKSGESVKYLAPAHINIPKEIQVEVTTLEESVWYTIHPTDETDPTVLWEKF